MTLGGSGGKIAAALYLMQILGCWWIFLCSQFICSFKKPWLHIRSVSVALTFLMLYPASCCLLGGRLKMGVKWAFFILLVQAHWAGSWVHGSQEWGFFSILVPDTAARLWLVSLENLGHEIVPCSSPSGSWPLLFVNTGAGVDLSLKWVTGGLPCCSTAQPWWEIASPCCQYMVGGGFEWGGQTLSLEFIFAWDWGREGRFSTPPQVVLTSIPA